MLKDKIKKNPIQVSPPNLKIKVMREKKKKTRWRQIKER
jgi:hypothetical protein